MLKTAPNPVDVQDLQFKLHCRIKVFDNTENTNFPQPCSLVTCASRFGLIFIGTNSANIQVIQLRNIEDYSKSDGDKTDYPRRIFAVPSPPTHLSINCEHTVLAVVVIQNNTPCALFYDVKSFWRQEVVQLGEIRLSPTPGVFIVDVSWNPTLAPVFTACKSDGSLGIYEVKNPGIDINELPAASGATCFCWSPKGKQIAVGSRDGRITQYKPDLKAVKAINAPPMQEPHSLQCLQWVSNYQFIGVFQPMNPSEASVFIVVDAPKTGDPTFTNYYDICYSNGSVRPVQFYTILLQNWNILMAASSNSMEVGIMGSIGDAWTQWIMGDAARAELPISAKQQETLPIGFGIDIGRTKPLTWGETSLPPVPLLLLLSHHGTLCCFNVVNLKAGVPSICTPPDPINDTTGAHLFVAIPSVVPTAQPIEVAKETTHAPAQLATVQPQQVNATSAPSIAQPLFGGLAKLTSVASAIKTTPVAPTIKTTPAATTQQPTLPSYQLATTAAAPFILKTPKPAQELTKTELVNDDRKAEEEAERIFAQMVREECVYLESELKAVLHLGRALKLDLGSDDDKTRIVQITQALDDFFKELADICTGQKAEVHILAQNLLQAMAWYEEANSRHLASQDESMLMLVRAQPLDSASEKRLENIRHLHYYLESQIAQAHLALDEQWDSFQDYCKKTPKMQIPTMEMIFQTMVKQNAILRKQSYVLKDIASRIKNKSRSALGPSLLISMDNAKDLPDELKRLRMDAEDIRQIQYERVTKRKNNLSQPKVDSLRSLLKKREYSKVVALKPQLSSSVLQASPSNKLRLSSLTARTPAIFKDAAKRLNFVQSTPIAPEATTPIEGLQNFALKFETKNLTNAGDKSFVPLTKSIIAGSPNSAFASTSFGSGVSTATSSTLSFKQPVMTSSAAKPSATFLAATTAGTQPIASTAPFEFGFNSQPPAASSIFGNIDKTSPNTSSTAAGASLFNLLTAKTPSFTNMTPKTTAPTLSFGASSISTTSAAASNTTIFGGSKPFTFASKATTTAAAQSGPITAATAVSSSTTTGFNLTKSPTTTPLAISKTAFATPVASKPATQFAINLTTTKTTAQSSIFGSASTTTTTTSAVKPSATTPATVTTATVTATISSSAPAVTSVSAKPSTSSSFFANQSIFGMKSPDSAPKPAIFAGSVTTTTTTPVSIFGSGEVSSASTKPSIFGATETSTSTTKPSILGSGEATAAATAPSVLGASIFGNTEAFSTPAKPAVFGGFGADTTTAKPLFAPVAATTTSGLFEATTPTTQTSSIFGNAPLAPATFGFGATTPSSIFGNAASIAPSTGGFGATATSTQSIFGSVSSSSPASFGGATPSTQSSIFGSVPPATSQPTIFGAANQTPAFGAPATSQPSIFGSQPSTTQPQAFGLFGNAPKSPIFASPTTTTQSSLFGSTNQTSVFGTAATTTSSAFGQTASVFEAAKSTPSVFGQSPAFGSTGSSFGNTSVFGASFGQPSVFGNAPTSTTGSIFGATPTVNPAFGATASVFGSPVSSTPSVFGSGNAFSSTAPQQSTASFGFGGLNVSSTPATSSAGFGTPAANPFGTPAATATTFGSSSGSIFGSASQSFGSGSAGFGQTVFGQSTFGSGFGQQPSGPFSGGAGSVAESGFGAAAAPNFQNQQGFGSAPVFGGSPTFGSTSSFGAAPAFGSPPAFGSTSKVFGAGTNPAFGASPTVQNAGFGNLANQQTVGFGNLAQQASNPSASNAPFSGNSSFSSWR